MTLRAEIISIGDELTSGQRLDTNSKWLSERLGDLGVKPAFHTTVGDSMTDNIDAFRNAARRADIVISSGGLGPTADDLTREAIALSYDVPLELRDEALKHIEGLFAARKRPMPERNRTQAMFPRGSRIVDNPHGTAPGIDFEIDRSKLETSSEPSGICRIFALPGVPAEMMQMFDATVQPRLMTEMGVGEQRWFFHSIKVFGVGESDVEKMLPDLIARDRDPIVGITVSKATITLRIAALCSSETEFHTKIESTKNQIYDKLGLLVFGEGELDLDQAVTDILMQHKKSLGLLEIGAGGWIASSMGPIAIDPKFGLQVSHWVPTLTRLAKQMPADFVVERIDKSDSVVDASLIQLTNGAEHLRMSHDLDFCLAAGVYPTLSEVSASKTLPSSDLTLAIARRGKPVKHTRVTLGAHPDVLYHRLAKAGMNFLRLELLQHG
jgi:nicotinamide-nucleotide amidase